MKSGQLSHPLCVFTSLLVAVCGALVVFLRPCRGIYVRKGELLKGRVSVRVSACQRCLCVYAGPSAVGPHFSAVP